MRARAGLGTLSTVPYREADPETPRLVLRPSASAWTRSLVFAGLVFLLTLVPTLASGKLHAVLAASVLLVAAIGVVLANAYARSSALLWIDGRDLLLRAGHAGSLWFVTTCFDAPSSCELEVRVIDGGAFREVVIHVEGRALPVIADTESAARSTVEEVERFLERHQIRVELIGG